MSSNTSNPEKSVPGTASAKPANPYAPIVRKTGNFLIKRPAHPAFPWPTRKFAKVRIWPKFYNHYLSCRFKIQIPVSYKHQIGKATNSIVKASEVGVITAANAKTMTMAYFLYFFRKEADRMPILPNSQHRIGISNTKPIIRLSIQNVPIYDCNEIRFSTDSSTW